MTRIVTTSQMRAIEHCGVAAGVSISELMMQAGRALAGWLEARVTSRRVLILIGPGNNGGDGVICARELIRRGCDVVLAVHKRNDVENVDARVFTIGDPGWQAWLGSQLQQAEVIVDALFGTGQNRPLDGTLEAVIQQVNADGLPNALRVAVDVPTGVWDDGSRVEGAAFRADVTLCLGQMKVATCLYPGAEYAGDVEVLPLGIPSTCIPDLPFRRADPAEVAPVFAPRASNSNKGTWGGVSIVGGSRNYLGAPALAALAAYRIGAGLVELITGDAVRDSVAAHVLEVIFSAVPDEDGYLSPNALPAILESTQHARALLVGPGLGRTRGTQELIAQVMREKFSPSLTAVVVDADGLNALSELHDWHDHNFQLVLTPHPGEMSRLTGQSIASVQANRLNIALEHSRAWNAVVVLKGAGTVVAAPDGRATINSSGGPNLATAGTGDVLSGTIAGLVAQGLASYEAAVAGVYVHGLAGDLMRSELGDAGMLASDLLAKLPLARKYLEQGPSNAG